MINERRGDMARTRWVLCVAFIAVLTAVGSAHAQVTFTDPRFSAEVLFSLDAFEANGLTFSPDGRLFVWQRSGKVWIYKNGAVLPTPFFDLGTEINVSLDDGLLGVAIDRNFAANGWVYLLYTFAGGGSRLTRVTANPANTDVALPGSEVVIFDAIPPGAAHVIGTVRASPDGTLFIGVGDLSSFDFVDSNALRAQDLGTPSGKILRMNVDGSPVPSNPFYDGTDSIRSRVWAYGLRNPFRFGLHPLTNEPYIGDVGWNNWEEINRGRGANFGWPCYEGAGPQPLYQAAFAECRNLPASAVTPPLYTYAHTSAGGAAVGGAFYTGTVYPSEFRRNFFISDYAFGTVSRMVFDVGDNLLSVEPFAAGIAGPTAIELGPDGLLYYVAIATGEVGRIRFAGPTARASGTPTAGYSPMTVSFSSAGSLDPNGQPLSYRWDFGDGTISTAANPSHTYTAAGIAHFTARLTVTDIQGISASATVKITLGSRLPVATISTPADGTPVLVGDVITFSGSAVDPDQGALPASALSWQVLLHHNEHVHPFAVATGTGGSFTVVDHATNATFAYEIVLNATDASGLVGTKSVLLPFNPQGLPYVTGVVVNPATLVGGGPATGTVTLSRPATAGGLAVALSSTRSSVQVPATVTVAAGSATATFNVTTSVVGASETATIRATLNGFEETTVTVTVPPRVAALTFSPNLVLGGTPTTATLRLNGPTGVGGATVTLTSDRVAAQVPSIVTVPAASDRITFPVTTTTVGTEVVATITATLNGTIQSQLTVNPVANGAVMNYADKAALLADGWDFVARTPGGTPRNTERTTGQVVSYDQVAHPGVIRIPADTGDLWGGQNDTRNTLFRDLPSNWTSIRMKIAAFTPTVNYQAACLVAYQNDDVYLTVCRDVSGGQIFEAWHESAGTPTTMLKVSSTATSNIMLRIDRQPATESLSAFFSINGGSTWTSLGGSVVKPLANPRLGIFVGGNGSTTVFPNADIASVQILTSAPLPPALSAAPSAVSFTAVVGGATPANTSVAITNGGSGGALSWSATVDQSWVTLSPTSGSTPGSINVGVNVTGLAAGVYHATVTLTSAQATNSPLSVPVTLTIATPGSGPSRIQFVYPDRAAFLADGWDFLARSVGGAIRNTEQTTGRVVSFDQVGHPGVIRIPTDLGDLWGANNTTRNTLFRDLPPDWTSIRMKVAAFAPSANYQAACLTAYQDDDNYVVACRNFTDGQVFEAWYETSAVPTVMAKTPGTATANVLLRLDRNATTQAISAFFSLDDGATWTPLGGVVKTLASPRLGIFVGANASSTAFPNADITYVEILTPVPAGPVLAANPTGLSFTGVVGGVNPATQTVSITNAGGGSLTWSATADQPWVTLAPVSGAAPGSITVGALTAGLSAGTRTATITVSSPQASNSPRQVTVSLLLTAPPALSAAPTSLAFSGAPGGPATATKPVSITNTGGGTLTWSATADQPWVTLSPAGGTAPTTLNVGTLPATLATGTHTATVTITAPGATGSPTTVGVTLVLTPTPVLALSPSSLTFNAVAGGSNPATQSVSVSNTGTGSLTWTAAGNQTWLTVTPGAGGAPGSTNVGAVITGLAAGTYTGIVTFTSPEATNSPRTVSVSLIVAPPPTLSAAPGSLTFNATVGAAAPATQTVTVTNSGSGSLTWSAVADQPWVTLNPTSGAAPGSITVGVLPAGLPVGPQTATITISSPQAVNSPRTVAVNLTVSAAGAHIVFTYANRAALIADGWDFLARTASGGNRNTERTTGLVVDYNQTAHPGRLRIPTDLGDLWGGGNDTRNTLFRNLPTTWTSIRLKVAAFAPTANWQNVCLVAYQNDDRYIAACRNFVDAQIFEAWHETGGSPAVLGKVNGAATTNILLRVDRNPSTEALSAFFSINDGGTWTPIGGSIVKALTNPRLGVFVGANGSTSVFPNADLEYVDIVTTP